MEGKENENLILFLLVIIGCVLVDSIGLQYWG